MTSRPTTYFDIERQRREARDASDELRARATAALELEAEMARRGWTAPRTARAYRRKFSVAHPRPLQHGSVARMLTRVERIFVALLPEPCQLCRAHPISSRSKAATAVSCYLLREGRPTEAPTCAWDWYDLRESEAAYQEYLRRRRALRPRLKRDPHLARRLRHVFNPPRAHHRGRPPGPGSPESLARALAAIEIGRDARTIARAPARLLRAMGH
jgi:hypothetical protein